MSVILKGFNGDYMPTPWGDMMSLTCGKANTPPLPALRGEGVYALLRDLPAQPLFHARRSAGAGCARPEVEFSNRELTFGDFVAVSGSFGIQNSSGF